MRSKPPAAADPRRRHLLRRLGAVTLIVPLRLAAQTATSEELDVALELYRLRLFQAIARLRAYPREALDQGLEGTAAFDLVISGAGSIKQLDIRESSGVPLLDREAAAQIRTAVPLTQIPLALQNKAFAIRLAIAFRLPQ